MKKIWMIFAFFLVFISSSTIYFVASSGDSYVEYKFLSGEKSSYFDYLKKNSDKSPGTDIISIESDDYIDSSGDVSKKDSNVETGSNSSVTYQFDIKDEGMYNVGINYCTLESKGLDILRSIKIDGKLPYDEADNITLKRMWTDKEEIRTINDNDVSPEQVEVLGCTNVKIEDTYRLAGKPLEIYFTAGKHTITIDGVQEPVALKTIEIVPIEEVPTYEQIQSSYKENGYQESTGQQILIEGEVASQKSSNELSPGMDYNSSNVTPNDPYHQKVNIIGGKKWGVPGDYLEWTIDAPEAGLYNITINANQNFDRDLYSTRRLWLNGTVPFQEAGNIKFLYNKDFKAYTLSSEDGTPYQFYLNQGENKLRLENVTGDLGIVSYQSSLANSILNEIYRQVLMITGTVPDKYRDYKLEESIDNLQYNLEALRDNLTLAENSIIEIVGSKGEVTSSMDKLIIQLNRFIEKPDNIAKELSSFKSNISSFTSQMKSLVSKNLTIDSIQVTSPDTEPVNKGKNFGKATLFNINRFISSFINNMDSASSIDANQGKTIEVWVTRGQDEMQSWRRVIDDYFTPQTGINVDLKLVGASALLPAVLSGEGPDVAMFLGQDVPVNYATRNAVVDLSSLDGYDEVSNRFYQSAITPFEYNGGVYGLPEEQKFPVMFYRKDIFDELSLKVPTTWDEVFDILPTLSANNMELMLEPTVVSTLGQVNPNLIFSTLLYQHGGEWYKNGDMESGLTEEKAIEAFKTYCKFYTNYSVDITADFSNRFKTGEAPIGIMDYTQYNQITIFAPELTENIGIAPVPGTVESDGSVNSHVASLTNGMVMFEDSEVKNESWEFMKWATSSDAQQKFAKELEARTGKGGRWQSANINALENSSYPSADLTQILEQQSKAIGVPQVPGGYISAREEENAFKSVVNEDANPTEAIFEHVISINQELTIKRKEFGLEYIEKEEKDEKENKE